MGRKLAFTKRPPSKKELRESREFYEAIGPLGRKRKRAALDQEDDRG